MKYKVASFIIATALFVGFYFVHPAKAASSEADVINSLTSQYNNVYMLKYHITSYYDSGYSNNFTSVGYHILYYGDDITRSVSYLNNLPYIYLSSNKYLYHSFSTQAYVTSFNGAFGYFPAYSGIKNSDQCTLVVVKGNLSGNTDNSNVFTDYDEYLESIQPTWWQKIWNAWDEFCNSSAGLSALTGDWLGYIDEVLFGELWSVKVGEDEDSGVEFFTVSATPSPSPSPTPTQIPVTVNIDPSTGNVTYNYTVIVSGTPVPTSSPINPNPPSGSGGGDGNSGLSEPVGVEDYYEPDDSLSLPNLRIFQFKLNLPGNDSDIGIDSLDNNFLVMNEYLEDNSEAITNVSSFFQVIPSEWFLLLGAIACFPIIAAMIKSLLGG